MKKKTYMKTLVEDSFDTSIATMLFKYNDEQQFRIVIRLWCRPNLSCKRTSLSIKRRIL